MTETDEEEYEEEYEEEPECFGEFKHGSEPCEWCALSDDCRLTFEEE